MKKKLSILLLLACLFTLQGFSQNRTDEVIFKEKIKIPLSATTAETAITIAKSFEGKPYEAATLEGNSQESLVCNLHEFDCFTFVENVLALTLVKSSKSVTFQNYQNILRNLRYRNGKINGYGSREHYFIDWMRQAEKNGILENISNKLGAEPTEKEINFMTKHRSLYPNLKDEKTYLEVVEAENNLNKAVFSYLPKSKVAKIESKIQDGDIIAITSSIEGLDCNHEGFAIRENGRIYLLHASLELKKVTISKETLVDYLGRIKKHSGILVVRLK